MSPCGGSEKAEIELVGEPDSLQVILDGRDVSAEIRTLEVAQAASIVSTISEVRRIMFVINARSATVIRRLRARRPRHRQRRLPKR